MARIDCRVGVTREGLDPPAGWDLLEGRSLADYFLVGSGNAIELVRSDPEPARIPDDEPTSIRQLHFALRRLLKGQGDAVGLLFADTLRTNDQVHHGLLGLMFDWGYDRPGYDGSSPLFLAKAREGCAVFVGAIRKFREQWSEAQRQRELTFTAIHELGHVFNLWHLDRPKDPPSFMRSSADAPSILDDPGNFTFLDRSAPSDPAGRWRQGQFLRGFPDSDHVRPRGSVYGERGSSAPGGDDGDDGASRAASSGLVLTATIAPSEFMYFEPVELDVTLALEPAARRARTVPNELDPAYERFRIWIEDPTGAVRRYRPHKRFCGTGGELRLEPGVPFRRDVSVFLEASGYAFRAPGAHRVWAELLLGRRAVRSAPVEVFVRPPTTPVDRELQALLDGPRPASFLFFRDLPRTGTWIEGLDQLARQRHATHAAASIHYAIGRARARAIAFAPEKRSRRRLRASAVEHLERSAEHPLLSEGRRARSTWALERLES